MNRERGVLDPYPTLNWLTWAAVLHQDVPGSDELLARCEATAGERFVIDRKFYTAIGMADARLVRALLEDRLSQNDGELTKRWTDCWKSIDKSSSRLHRRIRGTFGFEPDRQHRLLLDRLAPEHRRAETDATVARLRRLRGLICGSTSQADSGNLA